MRDMGTLGGNESRALALSADGAVVVGVSDTGFGYSSAFRWTPSGGMEDLNNTYGWLLTPGSYLAGARTISANGRFIAGWGFNARTWRIEAFLLDTGGNSFSISGNLELGDYGGDPSLVPVTVELRQNGNVVRAETVHTDQSGNYIIPNVQHGTYDLAFKASHWLRVLVPQITVASNVTGVNVALVNGDVDGDNEVTLFDFGELVAAFGSLPGDSNWNPEADLDGDEEVTLFDFGILVRNFGAIGDE